MEVRGTVVSILGDHAGCTGWVSGRKRGGGYNLGNGELRESTQQLLPQDAGAVQACTRNQCREWIGHIGGHPIDISLISNVRRAQKLQWKTVCNPSRLAEAGL